MSAAAKCPSVAATRALALVLIAGAADAEGAKALPVGGDELVERGVVERGADGRWRLTARGKELRRTLAVKHARSARAASNPGGRLG